jgi:hypothetical protein
MPAAPMLNSATATLGKINRLNPEEHTLSDIDGLHEENLAKIAPRELRVAYLYLVRVAEKIAGFRCEPRRKGYFNDFRYYCGTDWPYAFTINKHEGMLFYFRPASRKYDAPEAQDLAQLFSEVSEKNGETRVRINDVKDARTLMRLVFAMDG